MEEEKKMNFLRRNEKNNNNNYIDWFENISIWVRVTHRYIPIHVRK